MDLHVGAVVRMSVIILSQSGWKPQDQPRCTHIMIFVQQAFVSIYP